MTHPTSVHRLVTRLVRGIHHVPYKERFRKLKLFPQEYRSCLTLLQGQLEIGRGGTARRNSAIYGRVMKCWN